MKGLLPVKRNRHEKKRLHKYELKKKHARRYGTYYASIDELDAKEDFERDLISGALSKYHDSRNGGYNYWVDFSLTGPRQYAKYCTNRKIRAMYRNLASHPDHEHVPALRGSQYEKEFDYEYTIW